MAEATGEDWYVEFWLHQSTPRTGSAADRVHRPPTLAQREAEQVWHFARCDADRLELTSLENRLYYGPVSSVSGFTQPSPGGPVQFNMELYGEHHSALLSLHNGRLDVLPTGRNFYSVDNRAVPTPTAWELGQRSAENLLERHFQEHGAPLRALALSVWGTANMRTGGDDMAPGAMPRPMPALIPGPNSVGVAGASWSTEGVDSSSSSRSRASRTSSRAAAASSSTASDARTTSSSSGRRTCCVT